MNGTSSSSWSTGFSAVRPELYKNQVLPCVPEHIHQSTGLCNCIKLANLCQSESMQPAIVLNRKENTRKLLRLSITIAGAPQCGSLEL